MSLGNVVRLLSEGEREVWTSPRGNSMTPRIKSGQRVCIRPCEASDVAVGDIVLCRVRGNLYLHLVSAISKGRLQISNNHGHVNGWASQVYGRVTNTPAGGDGDRN